MATSSQIIPTGIVPVYPLHSAPLPQPSFVDARGNVWELAGHNKAGEQVLACPSPVDPEDAGEGESYPWTLREVERAFGPLTPRADVEERRLAQVDTEFLDYYGPRQSSWQRWQVENYLAAIAAVHAEFAPVQRQVAA
ncbi:hypothetical protein EF919_18435 [Streptomyces sp. WAC02707]|uniref:hypothetical protein n=1 Tax=Streptomyces sp. WAC02707 TaxID=2487417 RepID=UPI000F774E04|nr:hypothetical protein [Streptomyces sp. WAC02707]RSS92510.1 hypothetical protein EF919_18435 [Streptomyces sp. WAC02707]